MYFILMGMKKNSSTFASGAMVATARNRLRFSADASAPEPSSSAARSVKTSPVR